MPAYNYFPATYQPYYYPQNYQQPVQQPIQQPIQPIQQPVQQNQSSLVWFNGSEKEAFDYPVAPNNAVTLWSTTAPVVYKKVADASGKPTLTIYDLVERTQSLAAGVENQECKCIEYAPKSDVDTLLRDFAAIKSEIKVLKREISKSRKKEVVEDDDE